MKYLLDIHNLITTYKVEDEFMGGVEIEDLIVNRGEIVGLIGQSGSGKSTLMDAVLQTLPLKGGEIKSGGIYFKGNNLLEVSEGIIGNQIAYIPQDPHHSFDPLMSFYQNFKELISENKRSQLSLISDKRKVKILDRVGSLVRGMELDQFPHQFSGGMKQKVLIALALQPIPELILADEPTSNLDVHLERKVLELFYELKLKYKMSFLISTHNLSLAKVLCDRVYFLKEGSVVESGLTSRVFEKPKTDYVKQMIGSVIGGLSELPADAIKKKILAEMESA